MRLSQPYCFETEQDDEYLPAEASSSSSSRTLSSEIVLPPSALCMAWTPGTAVPGQSQRPLTALTTSTWNLRLKQLQGSKSQARKYPFLRHQFHLPTAGINQCSLLCTADTALTDTLRLQRAQVSPLQLSILTGNTV